MQSSSSTQKPNSVIVGGRQTEWQHSSNTLIESCISYSAHYLGSMEISNVEETEDSRRAMIKLKVKYSVNSYSHKYFLELKTAILLSFLLSHLFFSKYIFLERYSRNSQSSSCFTGNLSVGCSST